MEKVLTYLIGLLGAWLIVSINVFPDAVALWIAFGTAIAIAGSAAIAAGLAFVRGRRLASSLFAGVAGLGAFLIVASLIFEGASLGWLQAVGGAAVQFLALGSLAVQTAARPSLAVAPAAPAAERQAI